MHLRFYPDPILSQTATKVDLNDLHKNELQHNIDKMFQIMLAERGFGLAAPQAGLSVRIFVTEINNIPLTFINPVLEGLGGELISEKEGCLSFPKVWGKIERHTSCTVKAFDRDGEKFTFTSPDAISARAIQHELDHLDGILFIERFSKMDLESNRHLLRKMQRNAKKMQRNRNKKKTKPKKH